MSPLPHVRKRVEFRVLLHGGLAPLLLMGALADESAECDGATLQNEWELEERPTGQVSSKRPPDVPQTFGPSTLCTL